LFNSLYVTNIRQVGENLHDILLGLLVNTLDSFVINAVAPMILSTVNAIYSTTLLACSTPKTNGNRRRLTDGCNISDTYLDVSSPQDLFLQTRQHAVQHPTPPDVE